MSSKLNHLRVLLLSLFLACSIFSSGIAFADSKLPVGSDRKVKVYLLESVELVGTTRMRSDQVAEEFGLTPGTPLDNELVLNTRSRILGHGLFRSVILIMKRGSKPGMAKLIIEVEDDENVLSDWALGGEFSATISDTTTSTMETDTTPMDYRLGLVGRNILGDLHRGALLIDFDNEGIFRSGYIAYGLPRFSQEDVQFDAEIMATDTSHRYLDAMGFGARGQGLLSRTIQNMGVIQYGVAMYVNKEPRFAVEGAPKSVAGPKVSFVRETRFNSFFPQAGHRLTASALIAPGETENSVLELGLAKTFSFWRLLYLTFDVKALNIGDDGYSVRGEGRFDVPLGTPNPNENLAELFLRLKTGGDKFEDNPAVKGSAGILGVRYHSSGFIAELALKVTRSPKDVAETTHAFIEGGDQ